MFPKDRFIQYFVFLKINVFKHLNIVYVCMCVSSIFNFFFSFSFDKFFLSIVVVCCCLLFVVCCCCCSVDPLLSLLLSLLLQYRYANLISLSVCVCWHNHKNDDDDDYNNGNNNCIYDDDDDDDGHRLTISIFCIIFFLYFLDFHICLFNIFMCDNKNSFVSWIKWWKFISESMFEINTTAKMMVFIIDNDFHFRYNDDWNFFFSFYPLLGTQE